MSHVLILRILLTIVSFSLLFFKLIHKDWHASVYWGLATVYWGLAILEHMEV